MTKSNHTTKNILLLIPNLNVGGAQRVFFDHSKAFASDYNVYECVFNLENGHAFVSGNPLINLDVRGGNNVFSKIYYFLLRCIKVYYLKKKLKIDICISHLEGADYVNILSIGKSKVVLCIHGSKVFDDNISGIIGWFRKKVMIPFLYRGANHIVTVSKDIKKELVNYFSISPKKITVINNFFYPEKIKALSKIELEEKYKSLFSSSEILITIGRLTIQKNQKSLLHIFSGVKSSREIKLILVGDGELKNELIEEANLLGLKVYVESQKELSNQFDVYFLGSKENPFQFLIHATLFLLPSSWEGFPMVLGEALACGVPIISSDCPTGPREILIPEEVDSDLDVYKEFGVLLPVPKVNTDTIKIWVKVILRLLDDQTKRLDYTRKSAHRIQDYSKENIMLRWKNIIDSEYQN